jgi:hypothetical protein
MDLGGCVVAQGIIHNCAICLSQSAPWNYNTEGILCLRVLDSKLQGDPSIVVIEAPLRENSASVGSSS